jgi:hypothetical protein
MDEKTKKNLAFTERGIECYIVNAWNKRETKEASVQINSPLKKYYFNATTQ